MRYRNAERLDAVVESNGDVAWLRGRLRFLMTRKGADVQTDNRFLSVWIKEGGAWKMAAFASTPIREQVETR